VPQTSRPTIDRFNEKWVRDSNGCWLWTAAKNRDGYGFISVGGVWTAAHRVSYELFVGAIPESMEIDHLCRRRDCVQPEHLEAVSHAENVQRSEVGRYNRAKTHCAHGHPFDAVNARIERNGWRTCRTCKREQMRRYRKERA